MISWPVKGEIILRAFVAGLLTTLILSRPRKRERSHRASLDVTLELVEHRGHVLPLELGRFGQDVQKLCLGHGL